MYNWEQFNIDTVFAASNGEGVRYLGLFLKDYREVFGGTVNAGCKRCINNYLQKFKSYMKTKKPNSESQYVLKPKYEGLQIGLTGVFVNNKNITDDLAKKLLKVHAPEKIFAKYPVQERETAAEKKAREAAEKETADKLKAEQEAEAQAEADKKAQEDADAEAAKQKEIEDAQAAEAKAEKDKAEAIAASQAEDKANANAAKMNVVGSEVETGEATKSTAAPAEKQTSEDGKAKKSQHFSKPE